MNGQTKNQIQLASWITFCGAIAGCGGAATSTPKTGLVGRIGEYHQELQIVTDDGSLGGTKTYKTGDFKLNSAANSGLSSGLTITLGSIYLETQMAPLTVSGYALQASDVAVTGTDAYVSFDKVDVAGSVLKVGAVEHIYPYNCDNILTLTHTEYCLGAGNSVSTPTQELFSLATDGTNLYTVGSTLDETYAPSFGRLNKYALAANKDVGSLLTSVPLASYAGTSVDVVGSTVYTASGTSTDVTKMGGLAAWSTSALASLWSFNWYDARGVVVDRNVPTNIYGINGKNGATASSVIKVTASTGATTQTTSITGNDIAESKSTVIVGDKLMIASMGSQGFRVMCKATGATLQTVSAVTIPGIAAANTVTNAVAAAPGYLFTANGEAGVYVYTFKKSSTFNASYCDGVTVTLVGRLKLDTDNSDATYVNGELSANNVKTLTYLNLLNVISARFIMVASGNKGISLLNISDVTISTDAINDF